MSLSINRRIAVYIVTCAALFAALLLVPDVCSLPFLFIKACLVHEDAGLGFYRQYIPVWGAEAVLLLLSIILLKTVLFRQNARNDKTVLNFLCEKKADFFVLMMLAFFFASNARIMLKGGFVGYYNGWDYGDLFFYWGNWEALDAFIYPPFASLIYKLHYMFIPELQPDSLTAINYVVFIFILETLLPLSVLIYKLCEGSENSRLLMVLAFLLSGPILYQFQRGNQAFNALILLLFFLLFFQSENKFLRELAFICLAISANLKYYPAVFGMLLLKEERWGDALRCIIYGIIVFCLPVFLFKDIAFFQKFFYTLYDFYASGLGSFSLLEGGNSMSIKSLLYRNVLIYFNFQDNVNSFITSLCTLLFGGTTLFLVSIAKKKYQELFLLGCLCIFIPSLSFWYIASFLLPSLIFFFREERRTGIRYAVILVLYIAVFCYAVALSYALTPDRVWHIILLYVLMGSDAVREWRQERSFKAST